MGRTVKEIEDVLGGNINRQMNVESITGKYKKVWSGATKYGMGEKGTLTDSTGSIGFFLPAKYVGKLKDGELITISGAAGALEEYKGKLNLVLEMKGAELTLGGEYEELPEEILEQGTAPIKQVQSPKQMEADRLDMAMFQAITVIEKHKAKILELQKEGVIDKVNLNAFAATLLIDNKK